MKLRYLSLFSGIEACSVAWADLGWECVAVAEIDPFCNALLAHYYPNTPNLGDVSKITEDDIKALGDIDLIVFGSPCQDLSVAGKRAGFDGERSSLFYHAMRIVNYARKYNNLRFALWENVKGAFSSNKGRDFGSVVSQMAGIAKCPPPRKAGKTQAWHLAIMDSWNSVYWTHSFSESPKDAKECLLWQILERGKIDPRYYLSRQACLGIIRRAKARGKNLPPKLIEILQAQANSLPALA